MAASQYSSHVEGRAIYPTSGYMPYLVVLVAGKFGRSFGLFLSYDVLKVIHLIQFLCVVKGIASVILIFSQKPFTSGPRLDRKLWLKIAWHAAYGTVVNLLWLFGLTLCGPLRTILLFEHSEVVITSAATVLLFGGSGGPSKLRGAIFIVIAVVSLLLFDNDDVLATVQNHGQQGHAGFDSDHEKHSSIISHLFYHITTWFGLSDHKGGVCLLFLTLGLNCLHQNSAKKLAPAIGGLKRLYSVSTIISFVILAPWAFIVYMGIPTPKESMMSMLFPIVVITIFVFVVDHYVVSTAVLKVDNNTIARVGSMSIFVIALILSFFWSEAYRAQVTIHDHIQEIMAEEHMLSGGVIFSLIVLLFATHILTSPTKGVRGSFIGYSPSGLPLYNITGEALQRTSHSVSTVLRNGLKQILDETDSRRIFYFLVINLMFTFVELVYGVWTNSLGLISDGFHMLFDCSALVLGLYAAIMTRWKATRVFSFGYDRVEVLSGFINGLFLTVIAVFVFSTAVGRIFDPPEINTDRLLVVSVAGLVVNLIGMTAFSHAHTHGGQSCHGHGSAAPASSSTSSHGHSHGGGGSAHGHSHGGADHGHSHGGGGQDQQQHGSIRGSSNMKGVFLHVLADTLGSVGVIVSSILIENFGWNVADPICSLFIAIMIFVSVIPLLQETAQILLLRTPADMQKELDFALRKVLAVEGVKSCGQQHFWQHSSDKFCGTLHIQIREEAVEQKVIQQVNSIFKELGVTKMTVQVEKSAFYEHMSGLGTDSQTLTMITQNYRTPISFRHRTDYVKSV